MQDEEIKKKKKKELETSHDGLFTSSEICYEADAFWSADCSTQKRIEIVRVPAKLFVPHTFLFPSPKRINLVRNTKLWKKKTQPSTLPSSESKPRVTAKLWKRRLNFIYQSEYASCKSILLLPTSGANWISDKRPLYLLYGHTIHNGCILLLWSFLM